MAGTGQSRNRERFWAHTSPGPSGCILWVGCIGRQGYGVVPWRVDGKRITAHRFAWALLNGPIPSGLCIMHSCDVRACVNTAHLRVGTLAENNADALRKGRNAKGTRLPHAKLTEDLIPVVRSRVAAGESGNAVACSLGVRRGIVYDVVHGRTWRHV